MKAFIISFNRKEQRKKGKLDGSVTYILKNLGHFLTDLSKIRVKAVVCSDCLALNSVKI